MTMERSDKGHPCFDLRPEAWSALHKDQSADSGLQLPRALRPRQAKQKLVVLLTSLLSQFSGGIAIHKPTPKGPQGVPKVSAAEGAGAYPRSGHSGEAVAALKSASEEQPGASDPAIPAVSGEVHCNECFTTELNETCFGCVTENANVHCYACAVPICHACSLSHIYSNDCFCALHAQLILVKEVVMRDTLISLSTMI